MRAQESQLPRFDSSTKYASKYRLEMTTNHEFWGSKSIHFVLGGKTPEPGPKKW
jgi:hypothetical protein